MKRKRLFDMLFRIDPNHRFDGFLSAGGIRLLRSIPWSRLSVCLTSILALLLTNRTQEVSAQATLDLFQPNGFERTYSVNSTYGPSLGDSSFNSISNTGYWEGSGAVQSDNGNQGYARSEWNWTAGFNGQTTALDFRGFNFTMLNRSDSITSISPFQGQSGSNAQLGTRFELGFTVNQDQYYRLELDGGGYAATTAGYFGNGMAFAQAFGNLTIENQAIDLWNVVRENDGGSANSGLASTLYGVFHPGATHRVSLPNFYSYAGTGAAANLFSAFGTSNTVCSLTSDLELTDVAQSISLSELATRDVRFVSGSYSLPVLTDSQSIHVSVNPEASVSIAAGSVLNGRLNVEGQLNLTDNLGLSSTGIIAVGAGGIVAVGAGAGIVAPGAGGGIVAVGAGAGIVAPGAGGGFVNGGSGGLIIAPGAGGGIVAPGAGGGIIEVGAGGYLAGNGSLGNADQAISGEFAGQLAIGQSPGQLDVHGDFAFTATAELDFEIAGLDPGAGFDWLNVLEVDGDYGTVDLGGATLRLWVLDGYELNPELLNAQFDIVTAEGFITGAFGNISNGQRLETSDGRGSFLVNVYDHRITLSNFVAAVPEPSSLLLLMIFGCILVKGVRPSR